MRFLHPGIDNRSLTAYLFRDEFITADAAPIQEAVADSGSASVGTESSGTYASTHADDGTNWEIDETAGTPGFTLTMDFTAPVTGQSATNLVISGYYDGNIAHTVNVDAYDWVTEGYDNLGVLPDAVAETVYQFTLDADHTDTDGTVRIRINHASAGNITHQLHLDWVYIQDLVRQAEPGPGTLTIVDTENKLSISGSKLVFAGGKASPGAGDPGAWAGVLSRAAGQAVFTKVNMSDSNTSWPAGFDVNQTSSPYNAFRFDGGGIRWVEETSTKDYIGAFSTSTDYELAIIQRGTGEFYLIKGGAYTDWTLLYVAATSSTATAYPAIANYDSAFNVDYLRAAQLAAGWSTDNGIATDSIASPIATDTFTHEADFIFEILSSGSGIVSHIHFRKQDSNNYWQFSTHSSAFNLYEVVAGSPTLRATAAPTIANGDRLVLVFDDETITGYHENSQVWSYSSAANFKTETSGEVNAIGGSPTNLITWPRTPTGTANTQLEKYT